MKLLSQTTPFIRMSRYYFYKGGYGELQRIGYIYSIHLFTGGHGYMMIDGKKHTVENGTIVFIRPGQPHSFHIVDQPLQSYNIYCDLWTKEPPRSPLLQFSFYRDHFDGNCLTPQEPCPELDALPTCGSLRSFPPLIEQLEQIDKLFDHLQQYRQETVNSLFYSWLLQWHHSLHYTRPGDVRIVRLIRLMEAHPERRMSDEEWCRQCGLQRSYFYTLFKKETGLSPNDYLIRIRMKKAAAMLQESDRSVTSIAEELGYASVHYFTRQFTENYGVPPSHYRVYGAL